MFVRSPLLDGVGGLLGVAKNDDLLEEPLVDILRTANLDIRSPFYVALAPHCEARAIVSRIPHPPRSRFLSSSRRKVEGRKQEARRRKGEGEEGEGEAQGQGAGERILEAYPAPWPLELALTLAFGLADSSVFFPGLLLLAARA